MILRCQIVAIILPLIYCIGKFKISFTILNNGKKLLKSNLSNGAFCSKILVANSIFDSAKLGPDESDKADGEARKNPEATSRRCKGGGALTAAILKHKESYRKERSFYEFRTESLCDSFLSEKLRH